MNTPSELISGPVIGGVTEFGANLWARASGPGRLYAWLGQEPDLQDGHLAGSSEPLGPETGYAGIVPLRNLTPNTQYYYALALDDDPPSGDGFPGFKTFPPDGAPVSFSFAFGSCFIPETPAGGGIFDALAARAAQDDLRFVLLLGDQIYAEAFPRTGLDHIAVTLEDYRAVYAYNWTRPPLQRLLAGLPAFMTLDDHEVDNDWHFVDRARRIPRLPLWDTLWRTLQGRPPAERRLSLARVQNALQAYWEYQGIHAPALALMDIRSTTPAEAGRVPEGPLAYSFSCGPAAFFVLDTRTQRVRSRAYKTILGPEQMEALKTWLLEVRDAYPVKFLVSSGSLFYDMWVDVLADRWNGFPADREALIEFLARNEIHDLYVLSGDLHSAHGVRVELLPPGGPPFLVWEFASSPFEQVPTRIAKYTYRKVRSEYLGRQERLFLLPRLNFGVVRVDVDESGPPRVRFRVYGRDGELLAAVGS